MKKIIWLFGQSATGKKTLINKLLSGDVKTLEDLNFQGKKIVACKNTIIDDKQVLPTKPDNFTYDDKTLEKDNEYFNQEKAKNRRSCIMTDALSFLNSNNDILLIKGQDNDIWPHRGDIVKYFLSNFNNRDNVEINVYILMVENDEIWSQRIAKKEWFKNFPNQEEVMKNMLAERKSNKHESRVVAAFKESNIPIYFVESGENNYYFKTTEEALEKESLR